VIPGGKTFLSEDAFAGLRDLHAMLREIGHRIDESVKKIEKITAGK